MNVNSQVSHFVALPQTDLASEQSEHSQVVCSDTFLFTWIFCCENQINHMEKLQVYRLSN